MTERPGFAIRVAGLSGELIPQGLFEIEGRGPAAIVASPAHWQMLSKSVALFPASRWIPITPLDACLAQIRTALVTGPVLVLTSGDPLFFGFGRLLRHHFPETEIHFSPAVSSMQHCFARFGIPWDDAEFISLHGRPLALLEARLQSRKLFVFTDGENSPQRIARYLIERIGYPDIERYIMYIGEKLNTKDERIFAGSPAEIATLNCAEPNCLIIVNEPAEAWSAPAFGLLESELQHSRGLITKNEVRAAVLHALALPRQGVFWDIGAGSGSISIEAARMYPGLSVSAVERRAAELDHIEANRRRYRCWNLTIIPGTAPDILTALPPPDRVFIGGSGGNLAGIIRYLAAVVPEQARIVLTGVVPATIEMAPELLHRYGFLVDVSTVSVSRYRYRHSESRPFNPIHILKAQRYD